MSRKIIVCLACVTLVGLTLVGLHAVGPVLSEAEGQVGGRGSTPVQRTSPEAGLPRPWEAGIQVSPFSIVNLFNGNLATVVPLVGYDPVGPPVHFTLYHNSASAAGGGEMTSPTGFSFGPGWSCSYGGAVVGIPDDPNNPKVTVIEDDGNEYVFRFVGGVYEPEAGNHDLLKWDGTNSQWELIRPDQSKRIFALADEDDIRRLIKVYDSSGNYVEIERDEENNHRITAIVSAAETNESVGSHQLEFSYDGNDRLDYVEDPIGRKWEFEYYDEGLGALEKVEYPSGGPVDPTYTVFDYDAEDRIEQITNRDEVNWDYAYETEHGRLETVTDPAAEGSGDGAIQYFTFHEGWGPLWWTDYTDRREHVWKFGFDGPGTLRKTKDPLNYVRQYAYGSDRNPTSFTDELSHTWTATYGPVANVETVTSPIAGQTWTVTWEQPYPTERPNFYRVTQVSDPLEDNHWIKYRYEEQGETDPTLVTTMVEPATGGRDPDALTIFGWGDLPNDNGLLTGVTDANGVESEFRYDDYGYPDGGREGLPGCEPPDCWPTESGDPENNALGWPTQSKHLPSSCYEQIQYDANGKPTGTVCWTCQRGGEGAWPRRLGDPPSPHWGFLQRCLDSADYDDSGRPELLTLCQPRWPSGDGTREYELEYDNLGRAKHFTLRTNEHAGNEASNIEHRFDYYDPNDPNVPWYDPDGRVLRLRGPDGQKTEYWYDQENLGYDELGRPKKISRDSDSMSVEYTYDAAGRVTRVDYGNGTKIIRQYDNANRLEHIYHYGTGLVLLYQIDYVWRLDNTLDTRTESDWTGQSVQIATVEFEYDNRHRLTRETRTLGTEPPQTVYDIQYDYDQLGNRTVKIENAADRITYYEYDTDYEDPNDPNYPLAYPTRNNRLLKYEVYEDEVLTRTVEYVYYETGHVSNIIVKDEGEGNEYEWYRGLCFTYYGIGPSLAGLVLWDRWKDDGQGGFTDYEKLALREFRYHPNPRGRFMVRDLDHNDQQWQWSTVGPEHWTDYDRAMPYGDFDVTINGGAPVETEQMRYLEGFDLPAQQTVARGATQYVHGDLIRSTNLTTDDSGSSVASLAYTAFGEPIGDPDLLETRYQYAGGWGYESDLLVLEGAPGTMPITLRHVGHRWYDPSIGRFIQRDPIGIFGGLNVYAYTLDPPRPRPPGPFHPRDWWEHMRRFNRAIARHLKTAWNPDPAVRGLARRNLLGALRARGELFGNLGLVLCLYEGAMWVHRNAVEPGVRAAEDWARRTIPAEEQINRWRIGRQGGFRPGESDDLWRTVTY